MPEDGNKIIIYNSNKGEVKLDLRLDQETIWMNQSQISSLFATDRTSITRHINNIFKAKELAQKSNVQNLHISGSDRPVKYYSLDVILSVGYRVNSKKATKFRIWATKTLKDYLLKGYAVNEERLLKNYKSELENLKEVVKFITNKANLPLLENNQKELLKFLEKYSRSIKILEEFDKGEFNLSDKNIPTVAFGIESCLQIIENLREKIISTNPYNNFFGVDVENKLSGIIDNLNQTFDKNELYESIEEKAANLLYMIVKNHPFLDGNKRIGSMLFVYYLKENSALYDQNGVEKFNENTLVTLTLLVANSNPKEKSVIVSLIMRLIQT